MSDKPNFFDHFFDEKGPLASHLTNYQKRDGQVQMAQFIDESVTLKKNSGHRGWNRHRQDLGLFITAGAPK